MRTLAQLKAELSNPNGDLVSVRQAASELIEHIESLIEQLNQFQRGFQSHGHPFWTTDTNGKNMTLNAGQVVSVPGNGNPTGVGLSPYAAPGAPVRLGRPITT